MTIQRNNSALDAKVALRQAALEHIGNGYVFAPYIGFGECLLTSEFPTDRIVGCDSDMGAVEFWKAEHPSASVELRDATRWYFPDHAYSILDINAYGSPYDALRNFFARGRFISPLHLILTDGGMMHMLRARRPFDFTKMRFAKRNSTAMYEQIEDYTETVRAGIQGFSGCEVDLVDEHHKRDGGQDMFYFYFILSAAEDGESTLRRDSLWRAGLKDQRSIL